MIHDLELVNSLDEAIATAAAVLIFLKLNKLKLTERLEDGLQILLGNVEMNVANVKTMEWNRIGMGP